MPKISISLALKSGDSIYYSIESDVKTILDLKSYSSVFSIKEVISRSTIYPRFRINVLNQDETVWYTIPNEDILSGGSYSENYQNGSRRTLSFSLYNEDGRYTPSINKFWIGTKVSLEVGLEVPDESVTIWFKKGVFIMNTPKPSKSAETRTVSVECVDKYSRFESGWGTIPETIEIEAGTKIKDIIIDTLNTDMGNGYTLDPIPINYDPSFEGRETPIKISVSSGSTWSTLFEQIGEILSAEIFYDSDGRFTVTPIVETMSDGDKPVLYDYNISLLQNEDFDFDMSSFVNCVYIIGANINGHTYTASKRNDDPSSPLCVQRIGLRVADPITDSNITSDELAQERADYELRRKLIMGSTLSSTVFFNPLLEVNNIVTYTDDFYNLSRDRFLIQSVSFPLDYSGTMSLSVSNINNLPFVVS